MQDIFGTHAQGNVEVKQGSSWKPGGRDFLVDGSERFQSTQVAMESIMGHSVDMSVTDMVHVPAFPAKRSEMFSYTGYSAAQLQDGMEQFLYKVLMPEDHEFLDLDTCKFLFSDDPQGSLKWLLANGFQMVVNCWNFEAVLVAKENKAIWLHKPYCKAAPGIASSLELVVLRNMVIQLIKEIQVEVC